MHIACVRQDRAFLFTISRALKGILLSLLLAVLEQHLEMSILGSVQTAYMVNLKFSEIVKYAHRKTEKKKSTKGISF